MPRKSTKTAAAALLSPAAKPGPPPRQDGIADLSRETVAAAMMNSNPAVGAGVEAIGRAVAQSAEVAFQAASETARGLLGARTLEDVVRLQTDYAQRSFAAFVERSAKLTELAVALCGAGTSAWAERTKR